MHSYRSRLFEYFSMSPVIITVFKVGRQLRFLILLILVILSKKYPRLHALAAKITEFFALKQPSWEQRVPQQVLLARQQQVLPVQQQA